jgi:hypothetical protein
MLAPSDVGPSDFAVNGRHGSRDFKHLRFESAHPTDTHVIGHRGLHPVEAHPDETCLGLVRRSGAEASTQREACHFGLTERPVEAAAGHLR